MITLEELKQDLGITGTENDAYLTRQINRATAMIQNYCNRYFFIDEESGVTDDYIEHHKGTGGQYLNLKHYPIVHVTKVEVNTGTASVPSWAEIDGVYALNESGQLFSEVGFFPTENNYRVTYLGGYEDIPEDLKGACSDLVAHVFNSRGKQGLESEKLGEYSWKKSSNSGDPILDSGVKSVLDKYRVPVC